MLFIYMFFVQYQSEMGRLMIYRKSKATNDKERKQQKDTTSTESLLVALFQNNFIWALSFSFLSLYMLPGLQALPTFL